MDVRCKVATGYELKLSAVVWLQVSVENVTRIIAATVVEGDPGYSILLGRHWMASVSMLSNYKDGTYSIKEDNSRLQKKVIRSQKDIVIKETKEAKVESRSTDCKAAHLHQPKLKSRRVVYADTSGDTKKWDTEGDNELLRVIREGLDKDDYEADSEFNIGN